ncbi:hypothetical protein K501DRAFT_332265 [Backusella circina FSU 941]|nr:hypothetical protein K501DRAFT_332265 [Backusella circina FSU 941]
MKKRGAVKRPNHSLDDYFQNIDPISSDSEGVYSQDAQNERQEVTKIRRFSNDDPLPANSQFHDHISSFSTDFDLASQEQPHFEIEENVLKDLNDWKPEVHSADISEVEEEEEEEIDYSIIDTMPHFEPFEVSTPTLPEPELPQFARHHHSSKKKNNIPFIKNGMADTALKSILREQEEFDVWERHINREMASSRSIAHVCSKSKDAHVCRMLETWVDRGLVFSYCVLLNDEEMEQVLVSNSRTTDDDVIEEFSQPSSLPPYEYKEGDARVLLLFSFAYMNPTISKKRFIENEKLVGIWPPLNHLKLDFGEGEEDVLIVTRFKADSIY